MRPLRPPIENGIFHVVAKSTECRPLYVNDFDRVRFLGTVEEVTARCGWRCAAYCVMTTHFHLLVCTPNANLSRGMQLLNGWYAQAYNKKYGRHGHLFERRFWSLLVETDSQLLEAIRYVVLNPVRAGICRVPAAWPWSSYGAVKGAAPAPAFLDVTWTLGLFGGDLDRARIAFRRFVADGIAR